MPTATGDRTRIVQWLVVVGACLLAHVLSLRSQFYMDDFMHIVGNDRITEGDGLFSWRRLIPFVAYYGLYKLAGFSPVAFHALNLALHLAFTAIVFAAANDFRALSRKGTRSNESTGWFSFPLLVAVLFACHPLTSEPVNYARCTPIILVGMFSFVAAWGTLRCCQADCHRQRSCWLMLATLGVVGATFSKEPGLVHAIGSIGLVLWCGRNPSVRKSGRRRLSGVVLAGAGLSVVLLAGPAWTLSSVVLRAVSKPDFFEHAFTHFRVFWMYVQRMIVPTGLSVDHYVQWTNSWSDWQAWLALVGIIALLVLAVRLRRVQPLVTLSVMLVVWHLLLRAGYVIGHEMMVEYRIYPVMPWVALLIGLSVMALFERTSFHPMLVRLCASAVVVAFAMLSIARSVLWADPSALSRDALRQYPDNNRARAALMRQLVLQGKHDAVVDEHSRVVASVAKMTAVNQRPAGTRRYDSDRLIGDWSVAETSFAPALVEVAGRDAALEHLDKTIAVLMGGEPDSADPDNDLEKAAALKDSALADLVAFRDRLREADL